MTGRKWISFVLFLTFCSCAAPAQALSLLDDRIRFNGYLKAQGGLWLEDQSKYGMKGNDISMLRVTLQMDTLVQITEWAEFYCIFRGVREPDKYDGEVGMPSGYYNEAEMREFYLDVDVGENIHLRIGRQQVVWGMGYRLSMDDLSGDLATVLRKKSRNAQLFSGFVQNESALFDDRLRLTAGVKLEHNDYSGFEVQPSTRLLWTIDPENTLWASVARAVRTPSRAGHEIVVTLPLDPRAIGGFSDTSEELWAFEAGYRVRPFENFSTSVAIFYNLYDDLTSLEPGEPFETPEGEIVRPIVIRNKLSGDVYGVELSSDWMPRDWWSLHGAYSFLDVHLSRDADSEDPISLMIAETSPEHQFSFRSYVDLPWGLSLDTVFRYVDCLSAAIRQTTGTMRTGSYVALDVRAAWRLSENFELAVVGRDLLDKHHSEFTELVPTVRGTEVQRSIHGKVRWEF